ncbi:PREDICTED: putative peptidyl-tRNA hydrolase PTRHD1 isoform X2 [Acropora digitifera]|nr:PREDICTED: putative peptidyl-tRNA hydrolase PTRHD1 isoform X2 [Acropora digitifera]
MASNQLVQYVVVRGDLLKLPLWTTGAVIAQACHASTAALWSHRNDPNTIAYTNELDNMHKVVLEAPSEDGLKELSRNLSANQIDHKLWIEQPNGYPTSLATKPYPKETIRPFFKKLKLFQ